MPAVPFISNNKKKEEKTNLQNVNIVPSIISDDSRLVLCIPPSIQKIK